MNLKVKIALVRTGLSEKKIADKIGRSQTLVSMMFLGRHKGWEHRAEILRLLHLSKKDEAEVFNDPPPKTRRAA